MTQNKEKSLTKEWAEFIKLKRMLKGWSQSELAVRAYGDERRKSYISAIESGKTSPRLESLGYILIALESWCIPQEF